MTAVADLKRRADLTSAAAHINQAFKVSGLGNQAFADWLRMIAKDIETDGERALGQ